MGAAWGQKAAGGEAKAMAFSKLPAPNSVWIFPAVMAHYVLGSSTPTLKPSLALVCLHSPLSHKSCWFGDYSFGDKRMPISSMDATQCITFAWGWGWGSDLTSALH